MSWLNLLPRKKRRRSHDRILATTRDFLGSLLDSGGVDQDSRINTKEMRQMDIEKLQNEYTDWLVENLPREYVENQDCSADVILFESLEGGQLTLNDDQKKWLKDFIKRWEKVEK